MLVWEDVSQINTFSTILDEIEEVGKPARHFITGNSQLKNVWTQRFKAWEYPFIYLWLEKLSEKLNLNRKLKVMDFGCGRSAFPEFLASKGFEVWGVDNDKNRFISPIKKEMDLYYPNVSYWVGEIFDFNLIKFDAIISCSVIEHIIPSEYRIKVIKKLKELLEPHGKMMHIVDFYFPELEAGEGNRTNFYELSKIFGFNIGDLAMCPGAPGFNFNKIREKINFIMPKKRKTQARIAIGDDM